MTGFGKATKIIGKKNFTIEARSVNSKMIDFRAKMPTELFPIEFELRKIATEMLQRGKVDVFIDISNLDNSPSEILNKNLFENYFAQVKSITQNYGVSDAEIVQAVLRIPGIYNNEEATWDEEELEMVLNLAKEAFENLNTFRRTEGQSIFDDLTNRTQLIINYLTLIGPLENERIVKLRERFNQNLAELNTTQSYDENRLEQELIYYIEKLDVSEEKTRLDQHCKFFLETIHSEDFSNGKKLSFISQEMGREINTLGSKANSAEIQKIVVGMKDELEKIKEQLANVL